MSSMVFENSAHKSQNTRAKYLSNAFSLSMLTTPASLFVMEVDTQTVKENLPLVSYIGHDATAQIVSEILETPIQVNRAQLKLYPGDLLFVFQLLQRLPEGKVLTHSEIASLPYKWMLVLQDSQNKSAPDVGFVDIKRAINMSDTEREDWRLEKHLDSQKTLERAR